MSSTLKTRRAEAVTPFEDIGAWAVGEHSRATLAEQILRNARRLTDSAELWLINRLARRLERPAIRGMQKAAEVSFAPDESFESWPDVLQLPAGLASPGLKNFAAAIDGPALVHVLRVPNGNPSAVGGLLVAPLAGQRPTAAMDRGLALLAGHAAAALANLQALEAARDRAAQLKALREATSQFASELDLDRVLAAICSRTRSLTRADAAYITLVDLEKGDIYAKATDGIRTPAFKAARVRLGDGLGGLVTKEGRPYYSSDYMRDARFVHVVDSVVAGEGLASVIGVPLKAGKPVIGVLYAAHRRVTPFSEEDVGFMEMLAEHASIAMENARLYSLMQESVDREKTLRDATEKQRSVLERLSKLHERLTDVELASRGLDDLLTEIGNVLGRRVVLTHKAADGSTAVAVAAGKDTLGWLCTEEAHDARPDPFEGHALEQAARVVAIHLLRDRAVLQAQYRASGEFLTELLQGTATHSKDVILRGQYFGIDLAKPLSALFILPPDEEKDYLEIVARTVRELSADCLVASRTGGIVALVTGHVPKRFAKTLIARFGQDAVRYTIGVAREAASLQGLAGAIAEARSAARGARAAGRIGQVMSRDELGAHGVLLEGETELRLFADRLLAPLTAYDAKHNAKLVETLDAYLESGSSPTDTARTLRLHINSLYYRLERIAEVARYDLKNPETRFELQLALRIRRATSITVA